MDEGIEREPLGYLSDATEAENPTAVDKVPTRTRTKRLTMVGAALAVVVVVSFVVIGAGGPGSSDAAAQVMLGARTTLAKNTVRLTISGSFSGNGQTLPVTGSGLANLSNNTESLSMSFDANYTKIQEEILVNGPSTYERIIEDGHNLVSRVMPGKVWLQGPESEASAEGIGIGSSNVLGQLEVLAQHGNSVVPLGPSTINGESVFGFQVSISQRTIDAAYKRLEAEGGAEAAAVKSFLGSTSFNQSVIKVWLGGTDHLLVSEQTDISLTQGSASVSGELTVDFSHYGLPVNLSFPASGAVTSYNAFKAAANHNHNGV